MESSTIKLKRRKLCECGCGEYAKSSNRFIKGHNAKILPPIPKRDRPNPILCKCGCGKYANSGKTYCWGHNNTGFNNPMKTENGRKQYQLSMLEKYGVDNNMKIPGFRQKVVNKRKTKLHYHLGNNITPERLKKLKENCSRAGKIGGFNRAIFWRENPKEFQKFLDKSHDPMVTASYSGVNHPCWRGGISYEPYCQNWIDEFKEMIKERDRYKCQNPDCRKNSKILIPHHINYVKKDCHPNNLITLCGSCNSRANFNREYWKQFYSKIMEKKYGKRTQ
jgi:hypothetical protein